MLLVNFFAETTLDKAGEEWNIIHGMCVFCNIHLHDFIKFWDRDCISLSAQDSKAGVFLRSIQLTTSISPDAGLHVLYLARIQSSWTRNQKRLSKAWSCEYYNWRLVYVGWKGFWGCCQLGWLFPEAYLVFSIFCTFTWAEFMYSYLQVNLYILI